MKGQTDTRKKGYGCQCKEVTMEQCIKISMINNRKKKKRRRKKERGREGEGNIERDKEMIESWRK